MIGAVPVIAAALAAVSDDEAIRSRYLLGDVHGLINAGRLDLAVRIAVDRMRSDPEWPSRLDEVDSILVDVNTAARWANPQEEQTYSAFQHGIVWRDWSGAALGLHPAPGWEVEPITRVYVLGKQLVFSDGSGVVLGATREQGPERRLQWARDLWIRSFGGMRGSQDAYLDEYLLPYALAELVLASQHTPEEEIKPYLRSRGSPL